MEDIRIKAIKEMLAEIDTEILYEFLYKGRSLNAICSVIDMDPVELACEEIPYRIQEGRKE